LSEHEVRARDIAVVDVAGDQPELVVLRQRPDSDLKRNQVGVRHQPAQKLE
jgi:hypothetical protein